MKLKPTEKIVIVAFAVSVGVLVGATLVAVTHKDDDSIVVSSEDTVDDENAGTDSSESASTATIASNLVTSDDEDDNAYDPYIKSDETEDEEASGDEEEAAGGSLFGSTSSSSQYKSKSEQLDEKYDAKSAEVAEKYAAKNSLKATTDENNYTSPAEGQSSVPATNKSSNNTSGSSSSNSGSSSNSSSTGTSSSSSTSTNVKKYIATLKLYGLGDSIMYGYANNGVGVLDSLAADGATIKDDESYSGAFICAAGSAVTTAPCIDTSQYQKIASAIGSNGYDSTTAIIVDGGGNDILEYAKEATGNTSSSVGLTISGGTSTEKDIELATRDLLTKLCRLVGNYNSTQTYKVPIVFLIPKYSSSSSGGNTLYDTYVNTWTTTVKSVCSEFSSYGVLVVNENSILSTTDMSDAIHPNASGYTKINSAVESKLYAYSKSN